MAEAAAMPPNAETQNGESAAMPDGQIPPKPEDGMTAPDGQTPPQDTKMPPITVMHEAPAPAMPEPPKMQLLENGMLLDGSNPEYVDPVPPLEWKSKDDISNAVLYGPPFSAPVTKLAAVLIYYRVPYKRIKKGKPGSPYMKVPVMDAGGRQVNDTTVILKNLLPALGVEFDQPWDYKLATVWDATFRKNVSQADCAKFAARFLVPCQCLSSFFARKIVQTFRHQYALNSKANPDYQSHPSDGLVEPCKEFKAEFKGMYHGGEMPDCADVLVYGFLAPNVYAGTDISISAINKSGLREWNTNMQKLIPYEQLFFGTVVASE
jgi:hypothetical protein